MDADTRIAVHEAVCAERYKGIQERLDRGQKKMESLQWQNYVLLVAVLFGPGSALELVKHFLKA
jgi:hypothetical protein